MLCAHDEAEDLISGEEKCNELSKELKVEHAVIFFYGLCQVVFSEIQGVSMRTRL